MACSKIYIILKQDSHEVLRSYTEPRSRTQGSARSPELAEFVSTGFGEESDSSTGLINMRRHIRPRATDNSACGDKAWSCNAVLYVI